MKVSSKPRIALWLALLLAEVAILVSLRMVGWKDIGYGIHWITCAVAALLPLVVVAVILVAGRFRFSMRMMLLSTALVAMFLSATLLPLRSAINSRRASRVLLSTGAPLHTVSSFDRVYKQLGYDPRPSDRANAPVDRTLPIWLRPLADDLLKIPVDEDVREIWLVNDGQVNVFCREAVNFRNIERVSVGPAVTRSAMEELRHTLPQLAQVTDVEVSANVPMDWLQSLRGIRTLFLSAESKPWRRLSTADLQDVAALPNLKVLWIFKYGVTDSDIKTLAGAKALKHLFLRHTSVTEAGAKELAAALPDCVIHRD